MNKTRQIRVIATMFAIWCIPIPGSSLLILPYAARNFDALPKWAQDRLIKIQSKT